MLSAGVAADLIGSIYEAGALPERWPGVLHNLGLAVGATGGNLIRATPSDVQMRSSPAIAQVTEDFAREGWNNRNSRLLRLLARAGYAGFLTDSDLHTSEELTSLPMYRDFLIPRGVAAGAATIIQGARDDALIVAIEGFSSHEASRRAAPILDALRPHLARAAMLSSEIQSARIESLTDAFNSVDSAVALLGEDGWLVAASNQFASYLGDVFADGPGRLRVLDETTDMRLSEALNSIQCCRKGMSIAVRDKHKVGVAVLQLIPARRDSRILFSKVAIFAVISPPGNNILPEADIIAALFDLTPAEARVARGIAMGLSPEKLSHQLNVSPATIRSQLKKVYAKTSTRRQSELSVLISKLSLSSSTD